MFQDIYTHTEKYIAWDRANRRSNVHTRKRRTPFREVRSSHDDNTISETDVPIGQGLRYPSQVFTDPEFAATVPKWEREEEEEVSNNKFIGDYYDTCAKCGETYCWCKSSDWEEGLLDIESSTANPNPTLEKTPSPETSRKLPAGWVEHRRRTVQATKENTRNIIIENAKSISQEEFNSNNSM